MITDPIVIVGASRTPIGGFMGELGDLSASALGAHAIEGALTSAGLPAAGVDEVIMGCVLQAGQGQAPARQAALSAALGEDTGSTTVNKMCGSGMKACMLAHDALVAGTNTAVVAGGMESMSNAPYLVEKARSGVRLGNATVLDHMFLDGLQDPFGRGDLMGSFAEDCAEHYQFTREAQDRYALQSLERACNATDNGDFEGELSTIIVQHRRGETVVDTDEQPRLARPDKIPHLRPAFRDGGTVTAANSSSISDGAAALVMMRESEAERRGLTPRAKLCGHTTHAQSPAWFTTAPIGAINKLIEKLGWSLDDIDLFEINEAFAVVAMAAIRDLDLDDERVNLRGGACALGHPIGASGARIMVTLLHALEANDAMRGIASLCIGGGEATAIGLERYR